MNSRNGSRDDWLVGGAALLLAINLMFFPWLTASVGFAGLSLSVSSSATGGRYGYLGVLAVIAALAVLVDLVLERRFPKLALPALGGTSATTRFSLALLTATSLALRFVLQIHFRGVVRFSWGFYLAVALAAGLVYLTEHAHNLERHGSSRPGGEREPGRPAGPPGARAV